MALWPRSLSSVAAAPGAEAAPEATGDQGSTTPQQRRGGITLHKTTKMPGPSKAWDNSFAYGAGRDPKPYKSVHVGTGGENAKSDAWLQKSMTNLEKRGGKAYSNNMSEKDREKLLSRMAADDCASPRSGVRSLRALHESLKRVAPDLDTAVPAADCST